MKKRLLSLGDAPTSDQLEEVVDGLLKMSREDFIKLLEDEELKQPLMQAVLYTREATVDELEDDDCAEYIFDGMINPLWAHVSSEDYEEVIIRITPIMVAILEVGGANASLAVNLIEVRSEKQGCWGHEDEAYSLLIENVKAADAAKPSDADETPTAA